MSISDNLSNVDNILDIERSFDLQVHKDIDNNNNNTTVTRSLLNPFSAKQQNHIKKFKLYIDKAPNAHCAVCNKMLNPEEAYDNIYQLKNNEKWTCEDWGYDAITTYPAEWINDNDSIPTLRRKTIKGTTITCKTRQKASASFQDVLKYPGKKEYVV
jgi:hypothetical protein